MFRQVTADEDEVLVKEGRSKANFVFNITLYAASIQRDDPLCLGPMFLPHRKKKLERNPWGLSIKSEL